jgi:hypothetical protein
LITLYITILFINFDEISIDILNKLSIKFEYGQTAILGYAENMFMLFF